MKVWGVEKKGGVFRNLPPSTVSCYDHSGRCDIRYLVRAFTKARYRPCGAVAHLAHLGSWAVATMSRRELA